MNKTNNIFVICGTDTGVGKTFVTGLICARLHALRKNFQVFKPFESGAVIKKNGKTIRPDTDHLCKMAGGTDPESANFYAFAEALAPAIAARRAGKKIKWGMVIKHISNAARPGKILLIEGAGGLLAPLAARKTNLDLARDLGARVLIIGRLGLGTINHTRLTYDKLIDEKISVAGIILSETDPDKSLAAKTNADELKRLGLPVWGVVKYQQKKINSPCLRFLGDLD